MAPEREIDLRERFQLLDEIDELRAALKKATEWIAVAGRTPEIQPGTRHTRVLVFTTGKQITEARYCKTSFNPVVYLWLDVRGRCIPVTDWMPLPDPPEVSPK